MDFFLSTLRAVVLNPNFQSSMMTVFSGLAQQLISHADNPEKVRQIATTVSNLAPVIVGAVVNGTPMQGHVDPKIVASAKKEIAHTDSTGD